MSIAEKESRLALFQNTKKVLGALITELWEDHYKEKSKKSGNEMENIAIKLTANGISNKILVIQNSINICDEEIKLLTA
ncbi:MAG: hypothetical protein H7259_11035 [Cytophagales bacterium]|nr:hypothetical protein [Cytophaga sp.]